MSKSPQYLRNIQKTGQDGEAAATSYLRGLGWEILTTNWHCPAGELDIVARDGDVIVFVEVKASRSRNGNPLAAITPRKRERLIASAWHYLEAQNLSDAHWRIDAIAVNLGQPGAAGIQHAEDALDWS